MQRISNFEILSCGPDTTVQAALARINNASPNTFQVVVSADRRVRGTVTDGDIRRAMLNGISMSETVDKCMSRSPIVGRKGDDQNNRMMLQRTWFLPVIDKDGQLDHVLVQPRIVSGFSHALLMAGGFGRRLGELTRDIPKPLLQVGDRPIIDRVLEQVESAGVSKITIALHYKAEQIRAFVESRSNIAQVSFIEEVEPLGTAGALAELANKVTEPLIVVNGDVLTQADISAMCEFNFRHGYDGTIAVCNYEVEVPYGVIRQTADGAFAAIEEKPRVNYFVAAGLYLLSPEFVALTPRGRCVDMPELLMLGRDAGLKIGLFPVHEYWKDIGRPGDLAAAHSDHGGNGQ